MAIPASPTMAFFRARRFNSLDRLSKDLKLSRTHAGETRLRRLLLLPIRRPSLPRGIPDPLSRSRAHRFPARGRRSTGVVVADTQLTLEVRDFGLDLLSLCFVANKGHLEGDGVDGHKGKG